MKRSWNLQRVGDIPVLIGQDEEFMLIPRPVVDKPDRKYSINQDELNSRAKGMFQNSKFLQEYDSKRPIYYISNCLGE